MGCCLRGSVTSWHGSKRWRLEQGRVHLPVHELRRVRVKHQVSTAESCCSGATTDILRKTCRSQIHQAKSWISVKGLAGAAYGQCDDLRVALLCWHEVPSIEKAYQKRRVRQSAISRRAAARQEWTWCCRRHFRTKVMNSACTKQRFDWHRGT